MRNLHDVCISLQFKQWWNLKSKNSLWGQFSQDKYCQNINLLSRKLDTRHSLMWKYLMKYKQEAEQHIQWRFKSGSYCFWWDDWLGVGPLVDYSHIDRPGNIKVSPFLQNGQWNEQMIRLYAPPLMVPRILGTHVQFQDGVPDVAIWKLNKNGLFSSSSAWNVIRQKKPKTKINTFIWQRHIPLKISFLLWRAIKYKLPTNERLAEFGVELKNYSCCIRPGMDTMDNIFVEGHFSKHIW